MSRVAFTCPACGESITAPASLTGESAPCPKCKVVVVGWPEPKVDAPTKASTPATSSPIYLFELILFAAGVATISGVAVFSALDEEEHRGHQAALGSAIGVGLSAGFLAAGLLAPFAVWYTTEPFRSAVAWGGVGFGVVGLVGATLSQLSPVFGSVVYLLGEPFSPLRLQLVPVHVFGLGLPSLLLGGIAGYLKAHNN